MKTIARLATSFLLLAAPALAQAARYEFSSVSSTCRVDPSLDVVGVPRIGSTFTVLVPQPSWFFGQRAWLFTGVRLPNPIDLTPLNPASCGTIAVEPLLVTPVPRGGMHPRVYPVVVSIPYETALIGVQFYQQSTTTAGQGIQVSSRVGHGTIGR